MYGLVPDTEVASVPSLNTVAMLKSVRWACPIQKRQSQMDIFSEILIIRRFKNCEYFNA